MRQAGEWAVLIFLMASGMGLTKSYGLKRCGLHFIRRRLARVVLPLWVTLALFYALDWALLDIRYPWQKILLSFAGVLDKSPPNASLWFVSMILYLYAAFFLVSAAPMPVGGKCALLVLVSFGTTALIARTSWLAFYFEGWTTYTFAFPLAVALMTYRRPLTANLARLVERHRALPCILLAVLAGAFFILPAARTVYFTAFIGTAVFCLDRAGAPPKWFQFIGDHSYELYLVHFPLLVSYDLVRGREPLAIHLGIYGLGIALLAVFLKRVCSRSLALPRSVQRRPEPSPAVDGGDRAAKIVHVITRLDMGGSSQNTLLTCRELARRYATVLVHGLTEESRMTPDEQVAVERLKAAAASRGTRFIPMPSLVRRIHPVLDLAALWGLWRHVRRERPDIVHTHTSKAGILGRLAARLAGVPHVVHTPHGHVFYGHFGRIGSCLFLALERRFARMTDRLVALTGGERRDYLELGVGADPDIRLVHSGVEFESGENGGDAPGDPDARRRALGLHPGRRAVGFVGWLSPVKGPHHLLNAMQAVWSQHPDTDLVFVGRGDLEGALAAQAAFAGRADRVRFLGWRADVRGIMPLFDLLVLPSLNEGMGRVLLEAMAAGRPVVASRIGGIPDLVRDEENGLLVPPGDEQALAAGIARLLQDPALARRLGDAGRASCREFGVDEMAARLDRMYRELLAPEAAVMDGPVTAHPHGGPAAMRNECWPTG